MAGEFDGTSKLKVRNGDWWVIVADTGGIDSEHDSIPFDQYNEYSRFKTPFEELYQLDCPPKGFQDPKKQDSVGGSGKDEEE